MTKTVATLFALMTALPSASQAATLLSVDLSVANQVTISAEPGIVNTTAFGSDGVGIYLPDFFDTPGTGFNIGDDPGGNFASSNQIADGSARLFRASGDTGLNIYSFALGSLVSFTAGTPAFTGSATWTLTPGLYSEFVAAPGAGSLFFPADSAGDIAGLSPIGEFATSNAVVPAPVPVPASVLLLGSVLMGLGLFGRRKKAATSGMVPA